jgi:hypothetical protein
MKKVILFLSFFLTASIHYSFAVGDRDVDICVSNKISQKIIVKFKVSPNIGEYIGTGNYTTYTKNNYSLYEITLEPGSTPFFLFSYPKYFIPEERIRELEPSFHGIKPEDWKKSELQNLDISVQFRRIYEYFAVFDEEGRNLLNRETVKTEDFRNVSEEELVKEWVGLDYRKEPLENATNWILVIE